MKDPYFIYFLDLIFLSIIIISFLTINYQLDIKTDLENKKEIKDCLYDFVVIIFFTFFIITFLIFGYKYGMYKSFLIWCILNIITPIPESGLMLSLPLKRIFNFDLITSQIYITIISIVSIYSSYSTKLYSSFYIGNYFINIFKKYKLLILLSIISSFIGLILLDKEIDYYYNDIKFDNFILLLSSYLIIISLYFILFNKVIHSN